jgi:hypothetical protein
MKKMSECAAMLFGLAFACVIGTAAPVHAQLQTAAQNPAEPAMQDLARPAEAAPAPLILRDFVLTRGVEAREPVDRAESFRTTDERAYAFLRIANDGPATDLEVVWRYEGTVHGTVELSIGSSPGWRTWSSANLKPGDWTVEIRDAEGLVLARRGFTVDTAFAGAAEPAPKAGGDAAVPQLTQDPGAPARGTPMEPSATQSGGDG